MITCGKCGEKAGTSEELQWHEHYCCSSVLAAERLARIEALLDKGDIPVGLVSQILESNLGPIETGYGEKQPVIDTIDRLLEIESGWEAWVHGGFVKYARQVLGGYFPELDRPIKPGVREPIPDEKRNRIALAPPGSAFGLEIRPCRSTVGQATAHVFDFACGNFVTIKDGGALKGR
jgi:hypothetical protein